MSGPIVFGGSEALSLAFGGLWRGGENGFDELVVILFGGI